MSLTTLCCWGAAGLAPVFGRWSYWQRFDYWAPFWGLTIVGGSGLLLWFKELTAKVL